MTLLDRLPLPFWAIFAAILLLGVVSIGLEMVLEQRLATPGSQGQGDLTEAAATLLVVLYILLHLRLIRQTALRGLAQLRSAVKINDAVYDRYVTRMIRNNPRQEAGLLALGVGLVVVLLVLPPDGVRRLPHQQPGEVVAIGVILLYYLVAFSTLLNLVYVGVRNSIALTALSRQPLQVNVFDSAALLPFGRISLVQSLAFVGVFLIPLMIVGPPQAGGWLVIALSALSLVALFVPLWGVHQQIVRERERVLGNICGELLHVQGALLSAPPAAVAEMKTLADRTEVLLTFRKHILAGPSWPFRDFGAVIRAVAAAASPLIYLVLSQLVQTYLFPLFTQ